MIIVIFSCKENVTGNKENPCPPIEIVANPAYDSPAWHPSGNFIGFNHTPLDSITYPYGENCVGRQYFNYDSTGFWLINIDGTNKRRVLSFKLQTPAWSPDGKWIAFVSGAQIYRMPFDINKLVFDTIKIEQLTFKGRNFFPSWSPDGKWIAYDSNYDSPNGMNFIWIMKNEGVEKKRIAYDPEKGEIRMPYWASNNIIFHIRYSPKYNSSEIYSMFSNGSSTTRLTFNNNTDKYPKCSFNNKLAYFSNNNSGSLYQIWILDLSNMNTQQLTYQGGGAHSFSWFQNGEEIVYTKHDWNNWTMENGVLMIINIKSETERQLTFNK